MTMLMSGVLSGEIHCELSSPSFTYCSGWVSRGSRGISDTARPSPSFYRIKTNGRNQAINCENILLWVIVKAHSHVTITFAFTLDLCCPVLCCCPVLENVNVKCEHHHFLRYTPFMMFDENTNAVATCEQASDSESTMPFVMLLISFFLFAIVVGFC